MLGQPSQGSCISKPVSGAIQKREGQVCVLVPGLCILNPQRLSKNTKGAPSIQREKAAEPGPSSEITQVSLTEGPGTDSKVRCCRPWCCESSQQRSSFAALQQVRNPTAARTRKNLSTAEEKHTSGEAARSSYKKRGLWFRTAAFPSCTHSLRWLRRRG